MTRPTKREQLAATRLEHFHAHRTDRRPGSKASDRRRSASEPIAFAHSQREHKRNEGGRLMKVAMIEFDFTKAHRKEAWLFLETLWEGLKYLCQQVERVERERVKPDKNFAYVDFGSSPGDAMVCNYFLWYASALYNFIGVFEKVFSPSEDLQDEFKEVIKWRHKVAAHTAWVWPRPDDNSATRDMSILLFPEFNFRFDGHFEIGGMRIGSPTASGLPLTDDESLSDDASCAGWQWGLVRTHERLKEIVSKYAPAK